MLEENPHLPPAVIFLLRDVILPSTSYRDAAKRLRGLMREIRDQSYAHMTSSIKADENQHQTRSNKLEVHVSGTFDLFDPRSGCFVHEHRVARAKRLAQSVGLLADKIWLTDHVTDRFLVGGRPTAEMIHGILCDGLILRELLPLIAAGHVGFRTPWITICNECRDDFEATLEALTKETIKQFGRQLKIVETTDTYQTLDTGNCFDPPIPWVSTHSISNTPLSRRDLTYLFVYIQIRTTLWAAREARATGGSVISNSRLGLSALLNSEKHGLKRSELVMLERGNSLAIPWVSELTPKQVVQLKSEAQNALPVFREMLAKQLCDTGEGPEKKTKLDISDLRQMAAETRSELETAKRNSANFWKSSQGVLGFGLSLYGIFDNNPLAAVMGLLPILQLMSSHVSGHRKDMDKIIRKPGYVLVKAQDILDKANC